ncbi:IS1634 family transposase [Metallumcola ferriviriculae]|uniref:IS1634 family transposase n=1 Tax=Metallumcola ferriviriculae TaxID=3039180 RepID=A0AAU0URH6_9FIRM|nr:IS1634 family transposase [Desulfitibacteraceae bacterium MK1]WRO20739.1 IS1634 family transposase [Desulfitibacteraceae bacterium MK1]WRO22722.1 IS1634 family transposase [Desulfitibacteraceae bacterium MK1]WRO23163.1 IS1634 family transposase [Desulfitibacteraceae bacterium MK1]
MYVKKSISNGKVYLSFVQGYRQNGKVKQKTVEKLGYLEDLEKEYPDPIAHFKRVAKERTKNEVPQKKLELDLLAKLPDQAALRKNLGYTVPKSVYSLLGLREYFQNKQRHLIVDYNLNSIFSLLIFNRFLFPSSKRHAFETKDYFFESFDFSLADIYRALDYFAGYSNEIQRHLHSRISELIARDNQLGYYDVTNYYFEIPYEDEDEYDEDGNMIKKGQKKRGPSKEHRKDPIIQMGLLMDTNGIPMAFNTFSGGESEKLSLLPTIRRVKRDFALERIIVVADRGLNTSDNTTFLSGKNHDDMAGNDGYVYGQSVLGADKEFKEWVLNQEDYLIDKEEDKDGNTVFFKHKFRIHAKKIQLKGTDGKRAQKMEIFQKQMVYYSDKYAKKQKKDRDKAIAKAKELIAKPGKYTRATSIGAAGYVSNIKFLKQTGEIPDGLVLSLNEARIQKEEKYDGYYSIVTSEKHLSDREIRDIYKGLWEIEESFKVIKSEFKARPVYVKKDAHVEAHFLVCFVALVIMRVLEQMLEKKHTVKQIRNSLISYSCSYLEQNYYLFDYRDDVIESIESVFGFDLSKKIMSQAAIKKILQYKK